MYQDQRLLIISQVAKILATEYDLDAKLTELLACLTETLEGVEAGRLMLYDPADVQLKMVAAQGYDVDMLRPLCLAPGEGMSGKVFQSRQAEHYPTPEAIAAARESMALRNRELLKAAALGLGQPQSAICLPLITSQTIVGVLLLENRSQPNALAHIDLTFLQAVANLIALAIENARLKKELETTPSLPEADRLKAELLSALAHEMRTPLTSIKGYATALLMEEASFSPDTQREFLHIIDEECDTLQNVIQDLLESSVLDAGLLRLEPEPVMLPRLTKDVIEGVARRFPKHRFVVDFPTSFPIVDADPRRIAQVLQNLLDNAVKYSPESTMVVVRGERGEDEVVVSVADQGVGIAPEHLNRLFEKFFRIKSPLGRHIVGSGLGLPIVRTILESHGGSVWAESRLGEGSTFYFTLPLRGPSQELADLEEQ